MNRIHFPVLAVGCLLGILLLSSGTGCDSAPGTYAPEGRPPLLSNLTFSPDRVVFEALDPSQVEGDSIAVIDIEITLDVAAPDAAIEYVECSVQSPFDAFSPLTAEQLSPSGSGSYAGSAQLNLPRGDIGLYTIVCFAVDREEQLSNQVRGLFRFEAGGGSPPVIESVEGPDEIRPPTTLAFVAVVSDPDGLNNVASVVVRTPNGNELEMFDDGQSQGDEVARDGRYTASFDVPGADPGTFVFEFQAFDRFGLASEIVTKEVTVVQ